MARCPRAIHANLTDQIDGVVVILGARALPKSGATRGIAGCDTSQHGKRPHDVAEVFAIVIVEDTLGYLDKAAGTRQERQSIV